MLNHECFTSLSDLSIGQSKQNLCCNNNKNKGNATKIRWKAHENKKTA